MIIYFLQISVSTIFEQLINGRVPTEPQPIQVSKGNLVSRRSILTCELATSSGKR